MDPRRYRFSEMPPAPAVKVATMEEIDLSGKWLEL
jgi:hypothetical protein